MNPSICWVATVASAKLARLRLWDGKRSHGQRPTRETGWYHIYGMRKTTVYLNDDEAEALRQLAAASGTSQAELIREAVRRAVAQPPARQFRSLGRGASTGTASNSA